MRDHEAPSSPGEKSEHWFGEPVKTLSVEACKVPQWRTKTGPNLLSVAHSGQDGDVLDSLIYDVCFVLNGGS